MRWRLSSTSESRAPHRGEDHRACTLSHALFPYSDLWDPLWRIFDAFGFERCLWGTDWTRAVALLTYEQGVEAFRVTHRLSDSDRAALMGETLQRVYNWSPSQA
jgi:L-fuconolactonase